MREIVDAIPYGSNIVISTSQAEVTDGRDGDLYIFKSASENTVHKTHIVVRQTTQTAPSLIGLLFFGYLRFDSSLPCQWYRVDMELVS